MAAGPSPQNRGIAVRRPVPLSRCKIGFARAGTGPRGQGSSGRAAAAGRGRGLGWTWAWAWGGFHLPWSCRSFRKMRSMAHPKKGPRASTSCASCTRARASQRPCPQVSCVGPGRRVGPAGELISHHGHRDKQSPFGSGLLPRVHSSQSPALVCLDVLPGRSRAIGFSASRGPRLVFSRTTPRAPFLSPRQGVQGRSPTFPGVLIPPVERGPLQGYLLT